MYGEDEKQNLMDELREMERLKVDTGDEGKILQNDLIDFIVNGNGDEDDLIFRIEYYFYAFKLFCRRKVLLKDNEFSVYLNDSILEFEKIDLVKRDLDRFDLVIEAVSENGDVFINLSFIYHY